MSEMQQQDNTGPTIEEKAMNLGWVPADQWRGNPDEHVSAEEYVEKGEKILPIANQNNDRLHQEIFDLKQSVKELSQLSVDAQKRAREAGYRKAIADRTEIQAKAIADGDADAFTKAENEKNQLISQQAREEQEASEQVVTSDLQTVARNFAAANPWMNQHFELNETLERATKFLMGSRPDLQNDPAQFMAEARKIVVQQHPNHTAFANEAPQGGGSAPTLEGGGSRSVSGRRGRNNASSLPAEAVEAADRYIAQGLYKTREEFAAVYYEGDDQ